MQVPNYSQILVLNVQRRTQRQEYEIHYGDTHTRHESQ